MQMQQTTIRIYKKLKKDIDQKALEEDTSFQAIVDTALREYLDRARQKSAESIVLASHNLGQPLDSINRDDIYGSPKV